MRFGVSFFLAGLGNLNFGIVGLNLGIVKHHQDFDIYNRDNPD